VSVVIVFVKCLVLRVAGLQRQGQCSAAPVPGGHHAHGAAVRLRLLHHAAPTAEDDSTAHDWGESREPMELNVPVLWRHTLDDVRLLGCNVVWTCR
jgi:hypothetical protein